VWDQDTHGVTHLADRGIKFCHVDYNGIVIQESFGALPLSALMGPVYAERKG
jgi:hypothetical protein